MSLPPSMDTARCQPDRSVDLRDGLEEFDPAASSHAVGPGASPAAVDDDDAFDVEWPSDATTEVDGCAVEPEGVSPELVWIADAPEGLAAFAADANRSPRATLDLIAWRWANDVAPTHPWRHYWLRRTAPAAALCAVLAAVSDGLVAPRPAATQVSAEVAFAPAHDATLASHDSHAPAAAASPSAPDSVAVAAAVPAATAIAPPVERVPSVPPQTHTLDADIRAVPSDTSPSLLGADSASAVALPRPFASRGLDADDPTAEVQDARAENTASYGVLHAVPATALAAASVPTSFSPPVRELDVRAIENVLGHYRSAFNRLDAGAALAVWPSVNEKTLARAFDSLEDQDVAFENCQIEIIAVLAEAACSGSARYVPKVGSRTPKAGARHWRFSLRKASGAWLIDRVEAR